MTEETKNPTLKEIFLQITELQRQLTENSQTSLHRLSDAITSLGEEEAEERYEQVTEICAVFARREDTLRRILAFYEKLYDDLRENNAAAECIAFSETRHSKDETV